MQFWTSTIQRLLVVVVVMSGIALVGCRSTANRLSSLPGLGWMGADGDQRPMIASRDGSQLPPPSAVSDPYRRDAAAGSSSRNYDGSVASFARRDRYPTTGYGSESTSRSPATGYQTGPYDAASSRTDSRGESRSDVAAGRSRYYDQFVPGSGTNNSENYNSEPAKRYPTSNGYSSNRSSWSSDGGNNRYGGLGQQLDERVAQAQSRYSEVTQSLDQRAADAVQSLEQRAVNTTKDYTNVASAEARDFQRHAAEVAGEVKGRIDYAGRALDDVTNATTEPSRGYAADPQGAYGSTGRRDSRPSHYDPIARPTETPPVAREASTSTRTTEPWRPGSTSDYQMGNSQQQHSPPTHLRDAPDQGMGYRDSGYPEPIGNAR